MTPGTNLIMAPTGEFSRDHTAFAIERGAEPKMLIKSDRAAPHVKSGEWAPERLDAESALAALGTNRSRIVSVTVHLKSMADFGKMNECWDNWLGGIAAQARATAEAALAAERLLVEFTVLARLMRCLRIDQQTPFWIAIRRSPPWITLHLWQSVWSPLINRGRLFKQPGPLLGSV